MNLTNEAHWAAYTQRRQLRGLPDYPFHPGHVDPGAVARNAETAAYVSQLDTRAPDGADTHDPKDAA